MDDSGPFLWFRAVRLPEPIRTVRPGRSRAPEDKTRKPAGRQASSEGSAAFSRTRQNVVVSGSEE